MLECQLIAEVEHMGLRGKELISENPEEASDRAKQDILSTEGGSSWSSWG
jgi:hypothetical protein